MAHIDLCHQKDTPEAGEGSAQNITTDLYGNGIDSCQVGDFPVASGGVDLPTRNGEAKKKVTRHDGKKKNPEGPGKSQRFGFSEFLDYGGKGVDGIALAKQVIQTLGDVEHSEGGDEGGNSHAHRDPPVDAPENRPQQDGSENGSGGWPSRKLHQPRGGHRT